MSVYCTTCGNQVSATTGHTCYENIYLSSDAVPNWVSHEKTIAKLEARIVKLTSCLLKLKNEAIGFLSMADEQNHGRTNCQCLQLRIDEAIEVLSEDNKESAVTE